MHHLSKLIRAQSTSSSLGDARQTKSPNAQRSPGTDVMPRSGSSCESQHDVIMGIANMKMAFARLVFCDEEQSKIMEKHAFFDLLWQKCSIERSHAEKLFNYVDVDHNGALLVDEFCNLVNAGRAKEIAKVIGLANSVQLLYYMFVHACEIVGLGGDDPINDPQENHAWVRVATDLEVSEEDCQAMLAASRQLHKSIFPMSSATFDRLSVNQVCHALALEGTSAADPHSLLQVKHALLQYAFKLMDVDGSLIISAQEFMDAAIASGVEGDDAQMVLSQLLKNCGSGIKRADFSHYFNMERTQNVEPYKRVQRAFMSKALDTIFTKVHPGTAIEEKETGDKSVPDEWTDGRAVVMTSTTFAQALQELGVSRKIAMSTFLMLDRNHDATLSFQEVMDLLCGQERKQLGSNSRECQKQRNHHDLFRQLYARDFNQHTKELIHDIVEENEHFRGRLKEVLQKKRCTSLISILIILNTIFIGFETDFAVKGHQMNSGTSFAINFIFNAVFIFECLLKLYALRSEYFRDGYNVFDFVIAVAGLLDLIINSLQFEASLLAYFPVLRLLRILRMIRVLRLFKVLTAVKELRILVRGLACGLRALTWACALLLMFIYISAVFVCQVVGNVDDNSEFDEPTSVTGWDEPREMTRAYFGSVGRAMVTMFQIMTLESWANGIMRPLNEHFPWLWLFFIFFVCFTTLAILNLITGTFVEQTLAAAKMDHFERLMQEGNQRMKLLKKLHKLFQIGDTDSSGVITKQEFLVMIEQEQAIEAFQEFGIPISEMFDLFTTLDEDQDDTLTLDEFVKGVVKFHSEIHVRDILMLKSHVTRLLKQHSGRTDRILKSVQLLTERVTDIKVFVKKLEDEDAGQRKEVKVADALPPAPSPAAFTGLAGGLATSGSGIEIQSTVTKRLDEIDSKLNKLEIQSTPSVRPSIAITISNRLDEIDSKLNKLLPLLDLLQQSPDPMIQQSANSSTCCLAQRGNNMANSLLVRNPAIPVLSSN